METQILILASIILTALMGAIIGVIAISYREVIKKYEKVRQTQDEIATRADAERRKILDDARSQAQSIASEAQLKANQLISEAGTFSAQARQNLAEELKKAEVIQLGYYKDALAEIKAQAEGSLGGISKDVSQAVLSQFDAIRDSLVVEIQKAQAETRKSLADSYKKMEEEINAYKAQRLKRVDERIFEILKQVSVKAIGKSLNFEDHEDLVIKALEDAKRENVL